MSNTILNQFKIRKCLYLPLIIILIFGYTLSIFSLNIDFYHVYKILPVFVIYTDHIDNGKEATIRGPLIFIKKRSKMDKIILTHELTHAKQCYRYGFFHWLPLLFSDHLLAKMEAEAYATQIENENQIHDWASFIKKEYKISSISEKQIEDYIYYYWNKQK